MSEVKKLKIGDTSYDVRDATTLQNLTSAQETQILADGTYNGTAVASGTVFTTDEGKFKEYQLSSPTSFPTPSSLSGLSSTVYWVEHIGNRLVILERNSTNYWYSDDYGATLTASTLPTSCNSLMASGGYIFAYQHNSAGSAFCYSTDGVNWTTRTLPDDLTNGCSGIVYKNGTLVIGDRDNAGSSNSVYSTDMGETFTAVDHSGYHYNATRLANDLFFLCTTSGKLLYSSDGIEWSVSSTVGSTGYTLNDVDYVNGEYYVSINETGLYHSSSLTGTFSLSYSYPGHQLIYVNGIYVSLGWSPATLKYSITTGVPSSFTSVSLDSGYGRSVTSINNILFASTDMSVYKVDLRGTQTLLDLSAVDQTYNASSANAQSGVAIAGAGFLQNADSTSTNLSIKSSDNTVRLSATGGSVIKSEGYKVTIGYNPSGPNYSTVVGTDCHATDFGIAIGYNARTNYSGAYYSIAIGSTGSPSSYVSASGLESIAIGYRASSSQDYGVSLGADSAVSGGSGVALGYHAKATASYAIQLGYGTNSTANTLSVGLSDSNNYQLLDSAGNVPHARLSKIKETYTNPALTSVDGVCTWTVTHTLGTQDFVACVYDSSTYKEIMFTGIHTDTTTYTIEIASSSNISAGAYKLVMIG